MRKLLFMLGLMLCPAFAHSWDIEMSECPADYRFIDVRPSPDLISIQEGADAAYQAGYFVIRHHLVDFPEPGDVDPELHVTDILGELYSGAGWFRFYGHSDWTGSGISTWVDDDDGRDARNFWAFCYEQAGVPGEHIRYSERNGYIFCGIYYSAMNTWARLSNGIMEWWGCDTQSSQGNWDYSGARIVCLTNAGWSTSDAEDSDRYITRALKGNDPQYGRHYGGSSGAWNKGDNLVLDSSSQEWTTAWPGTYEASHSWSDNVSGNSTWVYVFFDTWCSPTGPASDYVSANGIWTAGEACFTYDRSYVNGIRVHISTTADTGVGTVFFYEMPSAYTSDLVWDGTTFTLRRGVGQASHVLGFRVVEDNATLSAEFETEFEHEVRSYRVEGASDPDNDDGWSLVTNITPQGTGAYHVELPGQRWAWYRLVETETDGNEIIHDLDVAQARTIITHYDTPSVEFLRRQCDAALDLRGDPPPLPIVDYPTLVIVPPEWVGDVEQFYCQPERNNGQTIFVEALDAWPRTAEEEEQLRQNIKDLTASYYNNEDIQMLWLVGSANDSTMLHNPWPTDAWESVRQGRLNAGYHGELALNVYPKGAYIEDARYGPDDNTAQCTWYIDSDDPYAFVDGDSIPDIGVCRLPVHDLTELLNHAYHKIGGDVGEYGPTGVSLVIGDVDTYGGADIIVTAMAEVEANMAAYLQKDHLFQSDYPGGANRNEAMIARYNGEYDGSRYPGDSPGRKEIHFGVSDDSGRYYPCEVYSVYDGMDLLALDSYSNYFPVGLWLSCMAGDNSRHRHPGMLEPMGIRMLTDHYYRGYSKWIGPSQGSKAVANAALAVELWEQISTDWNRPISIALWRAKRELLLDPEFESRDLRLSILGVADLGDPWTKVNTLRHPVSAPEQAMPSPRLLQNFPNPFNPRTRISFATGKPGPVKLDVIAVDGRLIRSLLNAEAWPAGRHEVTWDGRADSGNSMASGLYLYRLETGESRVSKKMLLLK